MKTEFKHIFLALFACLLFSCDESPTPAEEVISEITLHKGTTPQISFASSYENNITIDFQSTSDWASDIEDGKPWCTFVGDAIGNAGEFRSIKILATGNPLREERIAKITLTPQDGAEQIITITQPMGGIEFLNLLENMEVIIDAKDKSTETVQFNASVEWTAKVADDGQSWCTLSLESGVARDDYKMIITAVGHLESERETTVTITPKDGVGQEIRVIQSDGRFEIISPIGTEISFEPTVDSEVMKFNSDVSWEARVESAGNWCALSKSEGGAGDNQKITVSAKINPNTEREATITITPKDGLPRTIIVTQFGGGIVFDNNDDSEVNFTSNVGQKKDIQFTSKTDWTAIVTDDSEWCTISEASGDAGTHTITISSKENSSSERVAKVLIIPDGDSGSGQVNSRQIDITQAWGGINLDDSYRNIDGNGIGGKLDILFDATKKWQIVAMDPKQDWCEFGTGSGLAGDDNKIIFTSKVNTDTETTRETVFYIQALEEDNSVGSFERVVVKQGKKPQFIINDTKGTSIGAKLSGNPYDFYNVQIKLENAPKEGVEWTAKVHYDIEGEWEGLKFNQIGIANSWISKYQILAPPQATPTDKYPGEDDKKPLPTYSIYIRYSCEVLDQHIDVAFENTLSQGIVMELDNIFSNKQMFGYFILSARNVGDKVGDAFDFNGHGKNMLLGDAIKECQDWEDDFGTTGWRVPNDDEGFMLDWSTSTVEILNNNKVNVIVYSNIDYLDSKVRRVSLPFEDKFKDENNDNIMDGFGFHILPDPSSNTIDRLTIHKLPNNAWVLGMSFQANTNTPKNHVRCIKRLSDYRPGER